MAVLTSDLVQRFTNILRESISEASADSILLSGGLDTSTLAAFATQNGPVNAVTVCVPNSEAMDPDHQNMLVSKLVCEPEAFTSPDAAYAPVG